MVYVNLGHYTDYTLSNEGNRLHIRYDAEREAENQVKADYPYAVYRSQQEVTQHAQQVYQLWLTQVQKTVPNLNEYPAARDNVQEWNGYLNETKRLYVSSFVGKYIEEVAKKDGPAPQPAATPATNPLGATVTVIREQHTADIHRYWLRLEDPTHLDEPYEFPDLPVLRVDFSDTIESDIGTVDSSGTSARVSASSDVVTPSSSDKPKWTYIIPTPRDRLSQSQHNTPQSKKPRISWEK